MRNYISDMLFAVAAIMFFIDYRKKPFTAFKGIMTALIIVWAILLIKRIGD